MSWGSILIKGSPESLIRDIYVTLTGDILKAEGDITILDLLKVIYPKEEDIRKFKSVFELEAKLEETYQDTSEDSAKLKKLKEELKDARTNVQLFQKLKEHEQAYDRAKVAASRGRTKLTEVGRQYDRETGEPIDSVKLPLRQDRRRKRRLDRSNLLSVNSAKKLLDETKKKVQGKDLKTEEKKLKSLTSRIKTLEGKMNPQGPYIRPRKGTEGVGLEPRKLRGKTRTRPNVMNILNRVLANENKLKATTKKKVSKKRINSSVKRYEEFLEEYKDLIENETGEYDDDAFNDSLLEYKKQLDMFGKEIITVSSIRKLLTKEKSYFSELKTKLKKIPKEDENKYFAAFVKVELSEGRIRQYSKALKEAEDIYETKEVDAPLDALILLNLNLVANAFQEVSDAVTSLLSKFEGDEEASSKISKVVKLLKKGGSKLKDLQEKGQEVEEQYDTVMEIIFDDGERKRTATKPRIPMGAVSFRDDGRRKVTSQIKFEGRGSIPSKYLKHLKTLAMVATQYDSDESRIKINKKLSRFFKLDASYPLLSKLVQAIRSDKKDVSEFYSLNTKGSRIIRVPRYLSFQNNYEKIGEYLDTILDKFEQKPDIISAMSLYAESVLKKPALTSPTKVNLLEMLNDEKDRLEKRRKAKRDKPDKITEIPSDYKVPSAKDPVSEDSPRNLPKRAVKRLIDDIEELPKLKIADLMKVKQQKEILESDNPENETLAKLLLRDSDYRDKRDKILSEKRKLSRDLKEQFFRLSKNRRQKEYAALISRHGKELNVESVDDLTPNIKKDLLTLSIHEKPKMIALNERLNGLIEDAAQKIEQQPLYRSFDIIARILEVGGEEAFTIPKLPEKYTRETITVNSEELATDMKGISYEIVELIKERKIQKGELEKEIKELSKANLEVRNVLRQKEADEDFEMTLENLVSIPGYKVVTMPISGEVKVQKIEDYEKPDYFDAKSEEVMELYKELGEVNKQLKLFKKWVKFYEALADGKYDEALVGTYFSQKSPKKKEEDE